ncbi:MAG: hypothetical protein A2428_07285 [Bdellovibrionales bacterium RIFOXYC1_FULL_54_43]|nr:MAG: hypothetical protein A2428_07285 [Bdellovibrionales bacterium RIFOXYC1_FULL_54_43]OFZ85838.1 MAG: hypothetical protein A2603_13655 [Bdellovibrionales bacterium RIFOXYD1_FULL_55_31]
MATEIRETPPIRARDIPPAADMTAVERASISWRAIFAGAFLSLLFYSILMALGLAVGGASIRSAIESGSGGQGIGIGSAVWMIASVLISLFFGSYLAGRIAGRLPARIGKVQGMVIAALFFGFMLSQVATAVSLVGKGLGSTIGAIASTSGDLAKNPQVQDTVQQATAGLNLKSPPDQVLQGLATRLLRGDDEAAKNYLAQQAGISSKQADQRIKTVKANMKSTLTNVADSTAKVATAAGLVVFLSLVLGTLAGYLGGGVGAAFNLKRPLSDSDVEGVKRARAA